MATLRAKRRIFRDDPRSGSSRVRWEVQRGGAGLEADALWRLRLAVKDLPPEHAAGLAAIGVKGAAKALKKDQALLVFLCVEGVPTVLIQHLPVMCAFKKVPVAVIATNPETLGTAAAPFRPRQNGLRTAAVTLLKSCRREKRLAELVERLQASLPPVKLPFLRSASDAPRLRAQMQAEAVENTENLKKEEEAQAEDFIQFESPFAGSGWKGFQSAKGKGREKTVPWAGPPKRRRERGAPQKREERPLQGPSQLAKDEHPPVRNERLEPGLPRAEADPPEPIPELQVQDQQPSTASAQAPRFAAEGMTIFDFFDGMEGP
ncbi:Ankyrin repeat and SAM domain-containing protein 3 [Durusdinium trenchii]|uniref:Ankyrin repeat and SAM domain-containing protein 3 n=1 Tax=Durusdinium trenchii TaxID=1381693 RepID=A0ABP0MSU6_9DINO